MAIKCLNRGGHIDKHVLYEILNHRSMLHHHVIQFKKVFLTNKHLCIVMEYAPGGNLLEFIHKKRGLEMDGARWFFQQLVVGIDYCHQLGVYNRDIKLENTLLDDREWPILKICDFGYSKHVDKSLAMSRVGTVHYMAPEVVSCVKGKKYDGKKADIWSCGVFLYAMVFGTFPFGSKVDKSLNDNQRVIKTINSICHDELDFPDHRPITYDLQDLLSKLLEKDPEKRINVPEILQHKWYQRNLPHGALDMNKLLSRQTSGLQSEEEVKRIVEMAKSVPNEPVSLDALVDKHLKHLRNV